MKLMRVLIVTAVVFGLLQGNSLKAAEKAGVSGAAAGLKAETNQPLPAVGKQLTLTARTGKVGGKTVVVVGQDGKGAQLTITGADLPTVKQHYAMTKIPTNAGLKDGALNVSLQGVSNRISLVYYIRPDIHLYEGQDFANALKRWASRPAASQHAFRIDIRHQTDKLELWLDGRFLASLDMAEGWREARITTSAGAEFLSSVESEAPESAELLPLDLAGNIHQGEAALSGLKFDRDWPELKQKKLDAAAPDKQVDVGLARWLGQARDSDNFYDPFYMRDAWDGVPESILFRVPKRFYTTAWVLGAVDPRASPWMGVRICRYRQSWDGSGMTVGDTNVRLDPNDPQGLRSIFKVGTVTIRDGGKDIAAPVYLAAVPLQTGELADYLQWKGLDKGNEDWGDRLDWFNLEFSRALETRLKDNYGNFDIKPLGPKSGVHVLGVTLEKSPVEIYVKSEEPGFSFYKNKNPRLLIETRNLSDKAREIVLVAQVSDVDGRRQELRRTFPAAPGVATNEWRLGDLDLGWYEADLVFSDTAGRLMWRQSVTFALLPPDTRQAGDESPYGSWWFQNAHYTEPNPDLVMPLYQKMGFRHVTWGLKEDMAIFARHKVTPSMMGYQHKLTATNQVEMKAFITNWPTVHYAMIFHETGIDGLGLELPYELTGAPPRPLTEKGAKDLAALRQRAEDQSALIRAAKPDMKIILGNGFTVFNALWFREKLPTNVWDYCGMEMGIQPMHPEGQPTGFNLQSFWIARRMADIYGYTNMLITTCYESDFRSTGPGGLTLKRQADWYARDVLHCLAWRSPNINVALIIDVNASYYTSRWGATGVFRRSPLHMPKPSFVALATLTLMLDKAEYSRAAPTGSTGLYCLEFKKGKGYVYALWAGRGTRPVELDLAGGKLEAAVDSMARDMKLSPRDGKLALTASESPCYVALSKPVVGMTLGAPAYPEVKLAQSVVIDALGDIGKWKLAANADPAFETNCPYWPMTKGDVALEAGEGNTLKLTLRPQAGVADIVGRYAILEPANGPIPIAGKPNEIGVWVNGNAGWGRVYFEIEDAKGKRWTSNRNEDGQWDLSDWEAESSINHDGWRFVHLPLPALYPSGYYQPSFRHWQCQGDTGKSFEPAYPIKLARLYILLREKLVYVTDMVPPASPSIELKNLTAGNRI